MDTSTAELSEVLREVSRTSNRLSADGNRSIAASKDIDKVVQGVTELAERRRDGNYELDSGAKEALTKCVEGIQAIEAWREGGAKISPNILREINTLTALARRIADPFSTEFQFDPSIIRPARGLLDIGADIAAEVKRVIFDDMHQLGISDPAFIESIVTFAQNDPLITELQDSRSQVGDLLDLFSRNTPLGKFFDSEALLKEEATARSNGPQQLARQLRNLLEIRKSWEESTTSIQTVQRVDDLLGQRRPHLPRSSGPLPEILAKDLLQLMDSLPKSFDQLKRAVSTLVEEIDRYNVLRPEAEAAKEAFDTARFGKEKKKQRYDTAKSLALVCYNEDVSPRIIEARTSLVSAAYSTGLTRNQDLKDLTLEIMSEQEILLLMYETKLKQKPGEPPTDSNRYARISAVLNMMKITDRIDEKIDSLYDTARWSSIRAGNLLTELKTYLSCGTLGPSSAILYTELMGLRRRFTDKNDPPRQLSVSVSPDQTSNKAPVRARSAKALTVLSHYASGIVLSQLAGTLSAHSHFFKGGLFLEAFQRLGADIDRQIAALTRPERESRFFECARRAFLTARSGESAEQEAPVS